MCAPFFVLLQLATSVRWLHIPGEPMSMYDPTTSTGQTTSIYTVDQDPYQDLPDVAHRNIKVMVAAAVLLLKLTPTKARELLFHRLPRDWIGKMESSWAPLWVYRLVERNFARALGNPAALQEAAIFAAPRDGFGENTLWVFNLLRLITSLLLPIVSTPAFYFQRILPAVSRLFNRNKTTIPLQVEWDRALIKYERAEFAGKRLRSPRHDVFSMLWWAPGFTVGPLTFWQKDKIAIHHLVVELDPEDVFAACQEFIGTQYKLTSNHGRLFCAGEHIANRVRLWRDEAGHYTMLEPQDGEDYKWGWHIIADWSVHTPKGMAWIIFRGGETYCGEAGCSLTEYLYPPAGATTYGLRYMLAHIFPTFTAPLLWVVALAVRWCVNYLDRRALEAWERAELEELRLMLQRFGREHFASEEEMNAALRGETERRVLKDAVIVRLDFEGHTALRRSLGADALGAILRPFWLSVFDYDVSPQVISGHLPKHLKAGDVVVRFITFLGDGAYIAIYNAPLMVLVQVAIQFASYLHDQAEQLDLPGGKQLPLRVSITHGDVVLTAFGRRINPEDPFDDRRALTRQFAEGDALDAGSRYDEVAKALRRQAESLGQDANRFTLIATELFAHGEHDVQIERLGIQSVRDVGQVDLLRVCDAKAKPVAWSATRH